MKNFRALGVIGSLFAGAMSADAAESASDAESRSPAATVEARYQRGQKLLQEQNYAEALTELLWCYDEGMVSEGRYFGVRTSFLTTQLGRLAREYAPAVAALRARRDDAKARLLREPTDRNAPLEFAALNQALGDTPATLQMFEQLPAGDARRRGLAGRLFEELLAARRYADAALGRPFAQTERMLKHEMETLARLPEATRERSRQLMLRNAVKYFEAYAGAGELEHAQQLAAELGALDESAAMQTQLREAAARAGQPDLLTKK